MHWFSDETDPRRYLLNLIVEHVCQVVNGCVGECRAAGCEFPQRIDRSLPDRLTHSRLLAVRMLLRTHELVLQRGHEGTACAGGYHRLSFLVLLHWHVLAELLSRTPVVGALCQRAVGQHLESHRLFDRHDWLVRPLAVASASYRESDEGSCRKRC